MFSSAHRLRDRVVPLLPNDDPDNVGTLGDAATAADATAPPGPDARAPPRLGRRARALVFGPTSPLARAASAPSPCSTLRLCSSATFNPDPDVEGAEPPPPVRALRELCAAADALLISAPEYAHGVPGALKNALDCPP